MTPRKIISNKEQSKRNAMTPRVPLRRCRRCPLYHGMCPLQDLEPCILEPTKEQRLIACIVVTMIAIMVVVCVAVLVMKKKDVVEIPPQSAIELLRTQRNELSKWDKLIMAIALTESRYNPHAIGDAQDYGILQITPIYTMELNRLGFDYSHDDAFDIWKSIAMFNDMQSIKNPSKDIDVALHYHNPSKAYARKVKENLEFIEKYEQVRKSL